MFIATEYNYYTQQLENEERFDDLLCDDDNYTLLSYLFNKFLITPEEGILEIYNNM